MAKFQFSNNASALLAASIDDADTTIQVDSGFGSLFPSPGTDEQFAIRLVNASGDLEICYCTSRTGDLLTVIRAQEGTTAQSWTNGQTRVELSNTAGQMEEFLQRSGDAMEGDLDMGDNEVQNARMTGDTVVEGGQLVGTALRGTEDDDSNEVVVPDDGSPATSGGSPIATTDNIAGALPVGTILMWFGSLANVPDGFQLCDGTGGTPDLRNKFVRGAGDSVSLGGTGGAASKNTSTAGQHNHGGNTGGHALSISEMPSHSHNLRGQDDGLSDSPVGSVNTRVVGGTRAGNNERFVENNNEGNPFVESVGGGDAHNHSISQAGDHSHSINVIPPFVGVYFIMKVSA